MNSWPSVPVALFAALTLVSCAARPVEPSTDSTFLSLTSDAGDNIGLGQPAVYRYADGYWQVQIDSAHHVLYVAAHGPNYAWSWDLYLAAPTGRALTSGTYEGATRWPFEAPGDPGLAFTDEDRGCNTLTGRFVVDSLLVVSDTVVRYLHATFEQHCEGVTPALHGEVSVVANPWRANRPTPTTSVRRWLPN